MDAEEIDGEIVDEGRSARVGSAVAQVDRAWKPPALSMLSDTDFENRVAAAQLEVRRMAEIRRAVMTKDVDYGTIPGTDKPTLYQPGAQILNRMAGFVPEYQPHRTDGDGITGPVVAFEVRCILRDQSGAIVGEGLGEANSWEKKHRYRYNDRECPECGQSEIRTSQYAEKYYCRGCKAKFMPGSDGAQSIDAQPAMMENPDQHDVANTCLKIGAKRSYLAATMIAHACSGQFAQDAEDLPPKDEQDAAAGHQGATAPPPQRERPPAQSNGGGNGGGAVISEGQQKLVWARTKARLQALEYGCESSDLHACWDIVLAGIDVANVESIPKSQLDEVLAAIEAFE